MSYPALFQPIQIRNLELTNRIVIAPMCQSSAEDGCMTSWHQIHLGQLALSGASLLTIEATSVLPEGRITYADVGLYDDHTETAMRKTLESVRRWSDIPIGVQLSHAGRKASTEVPWAGGGQVPPTDARGWQTLGPSAIPYGNRFPPTAIDHDRLKKIRDAFAASTHRAQSLDLDLIQIHVAHGYLLHQFLSPLSNRRTDEYGGSLENRMRFPLQVFDAVRDAFPAHKPVSVRVSGTDWIDGGLEIEEVVAFAQALEKRGCDVIHVSTGGLDAAQKIPVGPSYQVPFARAVKSAVKKMATVAVGEITEPEQAEAIVGTGDADIVAIARAIVFNPRWPWRAAAELGAHVKVAPQYLRCQPRQYPNLFKV